MRRSWFAAGAGFALGFSRGLRAWGIRLRGVNHTRGGLDPMPVVGEASVGTQGANDAVAGDGGFLGAVEEAVEHGTHVAAAAPREAEGLRVTVKSSGRNVVMTGALSWAMPVEILL